MSYEALDVTYRFFLTFNGRYFEAPILIIPNTPKNIGKLLSPKKFPISKIAATTMSIIPTPNIDLFIHKIYKNQNLYYVKAVIG